MLNPDQIKPFILHTDHIISRAAICYFSESNLYLNDYSLMPLVLQRVKQLQNNETIFLYDAYRFPQTKETISTILELLDSTHSDDNINSQLTKMLLYSPLPLLEPYMERLAKHKDFNNKLQIRQNLINMNHVTLIEAFEQFIKDAYGKYMNEVDSYLGDSLIIELAERKCVDPDYVLHMLDSYDPDAYGYETIYYTQLAGELRLEAAIPMLCKFLGSEDEVLPDVAQQALVRIGTKSVVSTLIEGYGQSTEEYYRLYASDVFGRIKLPESEEALLQLLPHETDLTNATKLAKGLCDLGSITAIPSVHALVENGYDSGYLNLLEYLYALCVISNTQLPQLNSWRLELEAEEQRIARISNDTSWMLQDVFKMSTNQKINIGASTHSKKVGRNDPCPCGSGRKYKKCCGNT